MYSVLLCTSLYSVLRLYHGAKKIKNDQKLKSRVVHRFQKFHWQSLFKNKKNVVPHVESRQNQPFPKAYTNRHRMTQVQSIVLSNLRSKHEKECETKVVTMTLSSGISSPNFHNRLHLGYSLWKLAKPFEFLEPLHENYRNVSLKNKRQLWALLW